MLGEMAHKVRKNEVSKVRKKRCKAQGWEKEVQGQEKEAQGQKKEVARFEKRGREARLEERVFQGLKKKR